MANNLDHIADAAVACALRGDPEGYAVLVRDLDLLELRTLGSRLATHVAGALTDWAAESGTSAEQAADVWQRGMMIRARQAAAGDE